MPDDRAPAGLDDAPQQPGPWRRLGAGAVVVAIVLVTGGIGYLHHRANEPRTASAGRTVDVQVYYVGTTGAGERLFAEQHEIEDVTSTDAQAAVGAALGTSDDPDYHSAFPAGTRASVTQRGQRVTIDFVAGDVETAAPIGGNAAMGLQALVWTAESAIGEPIEVSFQVDGKPAPRLLGATAPRSVTEARAASTRAPVTIALEEGAELARGSLLYGEADAADGTVTWRLLQGEQVIRHGTVSTEQPGVLGRFELRVDAPPGSYTLELSVHSSGGVSPAGKAGKASKASKDTKDIEIQ